jgi:CubicO group peptidase (beta-lactamase class C family)
MRITCAFVAAALTLPNIAFAAPPVPDRASIAALEKAVPELMQQAKVPGLSLALVRNGQVYWTKGFGLKDGATPVTTSTTFEAASLSKPVFAYAVLKLKDQGKLDLDKPISGYLDAPYAADPRISAVTARMVLSHRTGFPNEVMPGQALAIHFNPGDHFSYSGEGFLYLQKAVERIEGRPLNEVMDELVFKPLGMTSSSYIWRPDFDESTAIGHDANGDPFKKGKPQQARAPSSLQTTAQDYARFLGALLTGQGLRRETLSEMEMPQTQVPSDCAVNCFDAPTGFSPDVSWGLGVGLEETLQGRALWHWGNNNDVFKAYMVAYPKARSGLVMFTNSHYGLSIANQIVKMALGSDQPAFVWLKNP